MPSFPRRAAVASALVAILLSGGCAEESDRGAPAPTTPAATTSTPATPAAVVREILDSQVDPPGAPGRTLTLVRYTIAPGAQLPAHVHPGIQMASIQSGTLTYTVISGTAEVRRGAAATPAPITGPVTTTLGPGDSVTETGDMVHYGANKTDASVVIVASLLTEDGRDLAITVPAAPPSTSGS